VEDRRRSHRTTLDDFLVDLLEFIEGKLWLAVADPDAQTRDIAQLAARLFNRTRLCGVRAGALVRVVCL